MTHSRMRLRAIAVLVFASFISSVSVAQETTPSAAQRPAAPEAIVIHPIMKGTVFCAEHRVGEGGDVGDALGSDCLLARPDSTAGAAAPLSFHRAGGRRNADWFGWGAMLVAPFDGVVESVHSNTDTNAVGVMKAARPGMIIFLRADGVRVVFGHVTDIGVRPGQRVRAGEAVARVGNNGRSRNPHTHVGAWKGSVPLPVRFDLAVPVG